jgi:histidinol dehydrogenase
MPLRLDARQPGFAQAFDTLVNARREADEDVSAAVREIVARVKAEGDTAVADYTSRFDRHDLDTSGWAIGKAERAAALAGLEPGLRKALELAADRIRIYHAAQRPSDSETTDAAGVRMGARWRAVEAAGLYVPGGRASYPSSVLMNAIPAKVAGVERLVMVRPRPMASSTRWSSPPPSWPASMKSGGSAARRRLPRWHSAPIASRRSM